MPSNTHYKYYVVTALNVSKPEYDLSAYVNTSHPTKAEAQRKMTSLRKAGIYQQITITACAGER